MTNQGWGIPSSSEAAELRASLEDVSGSLAAALARVEAFRIREKALTEELATLRKQLYGQAGTQTPPAPDSSVATATLQQARGTSSNQQQPGNSAPSAQQDAQGPVFTGVVNASPLYVTSLEQGEHPVSLVQSGGKRGCSIILAKDHLDFVEIRARILQHEFVGICPARDDHPASSTASGSALLCCFGAGARPADVAGDGFSDLMHGSPTAPGAPRSGQDGGGHGEHEGGAHHHHPRGGGAADRGLWEIHIPDGHGRTRTVKFEASNQTRLALHEHTQRWLGNDTSATDEAARRGGVDASGMAVPKPLLVGEHTLSLVGVESQILTPRHIRALASAIPPLERMRDWGLSYSTRVHGTSLGTLYRRMTSLVPTLTVVKDTAGYVFGCYTPEAWRIAPRFYGSGETFVFQLEPHALMWRWNSLSHSKNDFFQYSTPDCLALGGDGHFALHVDSELLQGSSALCGTFGSPCLASKEDFKLLLLEVWQVVS